MTDDDELGLIWSDRTKIADLWSFGTSKVPLERGVYRVENPTSLKPTFLEQSRGGLFKGKDPTVPLEQLRSLWLPIASVIYFGQAGGGKSNSHLRKRIGAFLDFGRGKPVGHRGGRLLWQIEEVSAFTISWCSLSDRDAREVERRLIADFVQKWGKRPFANLRD